MLDELLSKIKSYNPNTDVEKITKMCIRDRYNTYYAICFLY